MQKVYNTLSRRKEIFKPRRAGAIRFFVCGPTVYDFSHLGNARTYAAFDMMVKYLRQKGRSLFYLQNITDVDDKIIQRGQKQGLSPRALARRFEKEYLADMKALGVSAPTKYARATDYIPEIITQVKRLLKKGYAYEIADDGIYFDISKFKGYGKLSGRTILQAEDAVSRIDESVGKRNRGDFALWKFSKPGEPMWSCDSASTNSASLGTGLPAGRPGWHIEDTAIAEKFFGPQYDIHGGAQDLIFPHHEAEIAQMESLSGKKPFVRSWIHTGFLTVKGEKMSKSLGNFITIRDFLKNHSPRLLRYFFLKTHYRSPIDYSEALLEQAQNELSRIDEFTDRLRKKSKAQNPKSKIISKSKIQNPKYKFEKAMEDDFNTPLAMSVLFELVREGNSSLDKGEMTKAQAKEILDFLKEIDAYVVFIFWGRENMRVPDEIRDIAERRDAHRKRGNFQEADALRLELRSKGWTVRDNSSGYKLKKLI